MHEYYIIGINILSSTMLSRYQVTDAGGIALVLQVKVMDSPCVTFLLSRWFALGGNVGTAVNDKHKRWWNNPK